MNNHFKYENLIVGFGRLAKEENLLMLEIINLIEFYEDNKFVFSGFSRLMMLFYSFRKNFADLLKQHGVLNKEGKIEKAQKDIIELYCAFIFQKIRTWKT